MRDITKKDIVDSISSCGDHRWPTLAIAKSYLKAKGVRITGTQETFLSDIVDATIRDLKASNFKPRTD